MKKYSLFKLLEKIAEHYSRNAAIRIYAGVIIAIIGIFSAFSFTHSNETTSVRFEMGSISWVCVAAIIVVTIGFISIMLIQKCRNQYLIKQPDVTVEYLGYQILKPVFEKKCSQKAVPNNPVINITKQKHTSPLNLTLIDAIASFTKQTAELAKIEVVVGTKNESFVPVKFQICNEGDGTLRNYHFYLKFVDGVEDITDNNTKKSMSVLPAFVNQKGYLNTEELEYSLSSNSPLVGGLCISTDEFYIKPDPQAESIKAIWNIFADEFKCDGEITIPVSPYYIDNYNINTDYSDHIVRLTE